MFNVAKQWNPKQKLLKSIIYKEDRLNEAIDLILSLHKMVHASESSDRETTLQDEVWAGLTKKQFITMPTINDVTVAWNIWHITRIEDLTVNILIADSEQVYISGEWADKLRTSVTDTGNAMSDEEILELSTKISIDALKDYRNAVGLRTSEVIKSLKTSDMRAKVKPERLERILDEGGVLNVKDSIWLLDFWGKKDIAGLINMPITRHQVVHLNDSLKLIKKCDRI